MNERLLTIWHRFRMMYCYQYCVERIANTGKAHNLLLIEPTYNRYYGYRKESQDWLEKRGLYQSAIRLIESKCNAESPTIGGLH